MNILLKSKGEKYFFPERFNAEDITTIGENLYEIKLTIDPVTEVRIAEMLLIKCIFNFQTDVDMENSLDIKVRNTKNVKLPFNIEIQEDIFPDVRQKKT